MKNEEFVFGFASLADTGPLHYAGCTWSFASVADTIIEIKGVHHLIHSLIYMAYSLSIIGICMVTWLLSSSSTGRKRTARLASI